MIHLGGRSKSQSALEYLSTYAWAILIIAIILAAMYALGIFNSSVFVPRAQPGSCTVFRPNGTDSQYGINRVGLCADTLPEYIFRSKGVGDYIYVPGSNLSSSPLNIDGNLTITSWVEPVGTPYHDVVDKEGQYSMKLDYNNQPHPCLPSNFTGFCLEWDSNGNWTGPGAGIPNSGFGKWMFLGVSIRYNSTTNTSTKYWYANGQLIRVGNVVGEMQYNHTLFTIGAISKDSPNPGYGEAEWFNGSISNVQVYNASLPLSYISQMYQKGLAAPPIYLHNLVAWYPLNGNANDYSGNKLNGLTDNVVFGSSWYNGYVIP